MDITMKIARLVYKIRQNYPKLRLCQILSNAASEVRWGNNDLFYLPDEKLLEGLEKMKNKEML